MVHAWLIAEQWRRASRNERSIFRKIKKFLTSVVFFKYWISVYLVILVIIAKSITTFLEIIDGQ